MKNQLITIWSKYQIYIWPLLGGGISIILLSVVIIPQLFKVIENNKKIKETKQKIELLDKKASDLKQINLADYKDKYSKLNIVLPAQVDVPSAISQIQSLAASSNTQIISFSVALPSSEAQVDNFSIKLEFKGSSGSIKNFIEQLKNAPRIMTINTIDMTTDKTGSVFDVTLDIHTYFQKQQTILSGVEDSISLLSDKDKEALLNIDKSVKSIPIVSEETISGPKGKSNPFE